MHRVISVTRRHVEFLFNRTRDEVMYAPQDQALAIAARIASENSELMRRLSGYDGPPQDTELQLPCTDDCHVGDD